jgi:hypothetical protein
MVTHSCYLSRSYITVTPARGPKSPTSDDSANFGNLTTLTVYRRGTSCHVVVFVRDRRSDVGFAPVGDSGIRGEEER